MPRVTDPSLLGQLNAPVPIIPGMGAKPSAGFTTAPGGGQAYIPGSQADPAYAAELARREAAARLSADPRIGADLAKSRIDIARSQADLARSPAEARKAAADALKAEADAQKSLKEAQGANGQKTPDEVANLQREAIDKIALARSLRERSDSGWFATGFGAKTANALGVQPATDVAYDTDTLKNAGALQRVMEMAASNGGKNPLTPLSEGDFRAIANSLSNVDPGQSDAQYQRNVGRVEDLYRSMYERTGGKDLEGAVQSRMRAMGYLPAAAVGIQPNDGGTPGGGGISPTNPIAPSTDGFRTEQNPLRAGVNAKVNEMMRRGDSDANIQSYLASIGASGAANDALAFRRKHPDYRGNYDVNLETQRVQMSPGGAALNALGNSPVGAYAMNAADALTFGTLDNMTANPAQSRALMQGVNAQNPLASTLGAISGGAMAAGGLELGLGAGAARAGLGRMAATRSADALYGAGYGAGSSDDGDRLAGAGLGAAAGLGGGMFGRNAVRQLANTTRGVRNGAADYLMARGIPTTVGGVLGGTVKGIEDRLAGYPVIGDAVRNRRLEGFREFNREAFDQGLAPINSTTGGVIQEQGIDAARSARSAAYRNALDPVNVTADQPFINDIQSTINAGQALPDPMAGNADYTLRTRVGNSFDANGGLSGNDFQQSIRGLRRDEASMRNLPYGYDFGNVTRQAEAALENMLERQAPGAVPGYRAANTANRNVEVLKDAVNRARSGTRTGEHGIFAPSQLSDAAAANARRFGGGQGTTNQPFFDLTRAGQEVLPSSVPDSGTAGRLAMLAAPGALAAAGGTAGYAGGDTQTGAGAGLALGALLTAGGSRRGQQALTTLLARRPDIALTIADQLAQRQRIGGMFGAGAAASLLSGY